MLLTLAIGGKVSVYCAHLVKSGQAADVWGTGGNCMSNVIKTLDADQLNPADVVTYNEDSARYTPIRHAAQPFPL